MRQVENGNHFLSQVRLGNGVKAAPPCFCRVIPWLAVFLLLPQPVWASGDGGSQLLQAIGISILAATILGYLAYLLKQPLLLAYMAAGAAIGPQFGLGWVTNKQDIQIIAEIGLILLLFMIGLELDLKKLRESGKSLVLSGVWQFILCAALGFGFFYLLGFTIGEPYEYRIFGVKVLGGEYDLFYLAACMALSSTTIVVKLLHDNFQLDTLAGRLTLGILVFQDLWAMVVLTVQPCLANPQVLQIFWEIGETLLLLAVSLLLSKYILYAIFKKIAPRPELVLVASLGWCFFIAGLAQHLGLSMEMGALMAGVAISTFPYNLDVVARIISIRDFFITLFFVALGMEIPNPLVNLGMFWVAGAAALFLVASRFLSVFPLLYFLKNGNRVSLLTAINLSQISEFSLVITSIGLKSGHIVTDIQTIIIYVFVMTSVASTYMITYNHQLQKFLGGAAARLGFKDLQRPAEEAAEGAKEIVILGCFRVAEAFLREIASQDKELKNRVLVVDFNPHMLRRVRALGIKAVYGDVSHLETLHHAGVPEAQVVLSTIPDDLLVGTDNLKLMEQVKKIAPQARIVTTAESPGRARQLYEHGADYVFLPHDLAAAPLIPAMQRLLLGEQVVVVDEETARLQALQQVMP